MKHREVKSRMIERVLERLAQAGIDVASTTADVTLHGAAPAGDPA